MLLQDDMIDDVASFVAAAEVLKDRGAYKIYVMATHGLLSSDAPRLIDDSPIDEVGRGAPMKGFCTMNYAQLIEKYLPLPQKKPYIS